MTRCIEFYQKCEREGPDWCGKLPDAVRQIENYLDLCNEIAARGTPKETTFVGLPEGAARPLIKEQNPDVKDKVISSIAKSLNEGRNLVTGEFSKDRITAGDVVKAIQKVRYENLPKPEIPEGIYRVVYADPPWKYSNSIKQAMNNNTTVPTDYYPTMTTREICEIPLPNIEDNAVLFLWATSPLLEDAFDVIDAWGFEYKSSFVWDKGRPFFGYYNAMRHEFLLVATRGSCTPDSNTLESSVLTFPKTQHSAKPPEIRDMITRMYGNGQRIELFAREKIDGWDTYGNQL